MTDRRKRRTWSDDEKRMIITQTLVPGVSVSQVARRYDVNANLVFTWGRDPRFCGTNDIVPVDPTFLPVEVSPNTSLSEPERTCSERLGKVKIGLANGNHLEISGHYDLDVILRLAHGLAT
ncbi:MAG: transposase [Gammaproteobacteria bacterium]|jgi:transposase|nr:transposase [Alphaproteobacteria bacterium]MBT6479283.1 transposase [Gammaproteobacteria bacterium]